MVIIKFFDYKSTINKINISYSLVRPKSSDYSVKKVFSALYIKLTLLRKVNFSILLKAGGSY